MMSDIAKTLQELELSRGNEPVLGHAVADSSGSRLAELKSTDFITNFAEYFKLDPALLAQQEPQALQQKLFAILAELLNGVISLLQARNQTRAEFKLPQDMLKPLQNNPFLFAVNAKHALELLLRRQDDAFLGAKEATPAAVGLLLSHQSALLHAVEPGVLSLLTKLDPAEQKFTLGKTWGGLHADAKSWRLYQQLWQHEFLDLKASTQRFMDKFIEAYDVDS